MHVCLPVVQDTTKKSVPQTVKNLKLPEHGKIPFFKVTLIYNLYVSCTEIIFLVHKV